MVCGSGTSRLGCALAMENFDDPRDAGVTTSNVPEFTVSELSFALKREIETAFPRVRVRGEISQPSFPRSGHCYFRLKDENAVIDGVCWKGTIPRLGIRIEEGLEVIATGRLTTYAGSSRYQIIVDRLELAGEGALLKLLEDRRKKLAAEGLFDAERKRALPFLPEVVGVVTSPSGAVIRDILHRISDRFPRRVLVWPVAVQGEKAAGEVAAAIAGFNRLPEEGPVPRPDVLIVARGGGSLEDLWAFNEEIVVRAAAASTIPLISAVGHETDTTLIDFASDRRAPTPTAAAEMAVPVRADLIAQTLDFGKRTIACMNRVLREAALAVTGLARGLGDPLRLIEERQQRLDVSGERLALATRGLVERRGQALAAARLDKPGRRAGRQAAGADRRGARAGRRDAPLCRRHPPEDRAHVGSAGAVRRAAAALWRATCWSAVIGRSISSASFWRATPSIRCCSAALPWCATRTAIPCWRPPTRAPATRSASSSPTARSAPG